MPNLQQEPPFRVFDPTAEYFVAERHLPHWAQSGAVCFMTWRTWDSMPRHVVEAWIAEKSEWLRRHSINPFAADWKDRLNRLSATQQDAFRRIMSERWESCLDECHGECVLRRPDVAEIVAESLHHFDEERYWLSDFVVMPNHVHVLAAFREAEQMLAQCTSWKHYTATRINRLLGRRGRFWEVDGFDHLVRSPEQFGYYRKYIAGNPRRARLKQGEYLHYARM